MTDETNLKQTKGIFKVIGQVTRIDRDGAYNQGVGERGKRAGETYRSLRFGVKTSETNEITVSMFAYEPEKVFLWNSEKKKNDDNYKGDRIPFGQWEEQQDELREQGYAILDVRVGLEHDEKGKLKTKGLPAYVASEEIYDSLENGDSVVVEGEIRYSKYINRNGEEVEQKTHAIKKVFKIKDVDFHADDFEEVTYFEQEMVFIDADNDKKEGKTYVIGRTIDYLGNYQDSQFIIDYNNEDGDGHDEDMKKLATAFEKRMKFGDLINVFGDTLNRVIVEEVEDDGNDDEDNLLLALGGKSKPKHAEKFTSRTYVTEMHIHGVDEWDEGHYTEDDFVEQGVVEDEESDLTKDLGGKKKKKGANPFDLDDDDFDDISDDDLPF